MDLLKNKKATFQKEDGFFTDEPEKVTNWNLVKLASEYLSMTYPDRIWSVVAFNSDDDLSIKRDSSDNKLTHKTENVAYFVYPAKDELSVYDESLEIMLVCVSTNLTFSQPEVSKSQKKENHDQLVYLSNFEKKNNNEWTNWADD